MEFVFDIFFEIVTFIADFIGQILSESVEDSLQNKHPVKRTALAVGVGVLSWAVIVALGFAAFILFECVHPILGIIVAVIALFLIVLFFSVIIKLVQAKKNKGKNRNK